MEDPTQKLSDVLARALALADRIKDVAADTDASSWFALWKPAVGAVVRLAKTLAKLLLRLRQMTDDVELEPVDEGLRDELLRELSEIADEFPDIPDVLFGLSHLDDLYTALVQDPSARAAASALADTTVNALDELIGVLVDIVLGQRDSPIAPDRVVDAIQRYEGVAQRLLDRWIIPK